jgi:hypothetical protein
MYLVQEDVLRLLSQIPYLALAKPNSAKRYIELLVRDGTELEAILSQFPAVQYQPLDQHYVLLRAIGALCEELVSDLCANYSRRGIVWASFLVALAPAPEYRKYLVEASAYVPRNRWLLELALSEIDGTVWNPDAELQANIAKLRAMLSPLPRLATEFRRAPNTQEQHHIESGRERIKTAYRSGGLDAARKEIWKMRAG